ncbi:MAG: hypothetical protein MZU97_01115 [Bacillus subtilis]|nr:hypothetical protein [Bacillus subtilis]
MELEMNYSEAFQALAAVYVSDPNREMIQRYRDVYRYMTEDVVYYIMDVTVNDELDHYLWPLYYDTIDQWALDDTTQELLDTYEAFLDAVDQLGFIYIMTLATLVGDMIVAINFEYQDMLFYITPDDPYLENLYASWTVQIENSPRPIDAISRSLSLARESINEAFYEEAKTQAVEELEAFAYLEWQGLVVSSNLDLLETYYLSAQHDDWSCKYLVNYDFVIAWFNQQAFYLQ